MLDEYLNLSMVTWQEASVRVLLAVLFGLILGIDRDRKNKPIDYRAFMIVAVTSCVVAMLGQEIYTDFSANDHGASIDLGKIISGTLTGIGFLGAGAIIQQGDKQVIGTATGASIWAAGGIGLTLGFGFYTLAVIAFVAVAAILIVGGYGMSLFRGVSDKED
jgi:putative Mg2+ transporter-C (MgtC) family protein